MKTFELTETCTKKVEYKWALQIEGKEAQESYGVENIVAYFKDGFDFELYVHKNGQCREYVSGRLFSDLEDIKEPKLKKLVTDTLAYIRKNKKKQIKVNDSLSKSTHKEIELSREA